MMDCLFLDIEIIVMRRVVMRCSRVHGCCMMNLLRPHHCLSIPLKFFPVPSQVSPQVGHLEARLAVEQVPHRWPVVQHRPLL